MCVIFTVLNFYIIPNNTSFQLLEFYSAILFKPNETKKTHSVQSEQVT